MRMRREKGGLDSGVEETMETIARSTMLLLVHTVITVEHTMYTSVYI